MVWINIAIAERTQCSGSLAIDGIGNLKTLLKSDQEHLALCGLIDLFFSQTNKTALFGRSPKLDCSSLLDARAQSIDPARCSQLNLKRRAHVARWSTIVCGGRELTSTYDRTLTWTWSPRLSPPCPQRLPAHCREPAAAIMVLSSTSSLGPFTQNLMSTNKLGPDRDPVTPRTGTPTVHQSPITRSPPFIFQNGAKSGVGCVFCDAQHLTHLPYSVP